jgi:acetyl esterase/lipase
MNVVPDKWKEDYRSRVESRQDPILKFDKDVSESLNKELKPQESSPLFSPLLHPNLKSLPPAFFQVCGLDPLRDEALIYESVLKENGVETRLDVYDGFGHMFWMNW